MPDNNLWNTVTGIISLVLGVIAVINKQFRVPVAIASVVLILVVVVNQLFAEIDNLKKDQQRILERTDIYKELIDIKADIKNLKRGKT